jgi:hypothetical protein
MDSPSSLRRLSNIIAQAVTYIEVEYAKASAPLPSLDESFNPTTPAEAVGMQPAAFAASSMIIAAAAQITATVSNPALAIINKQFIGGEEAGFKFCLPHEKKEKKNTTSVSSFVVPSGRLGTGRC